MPEGRVVDARKNKSNLGSIYKAGLSVLHPADFKQPLSEELFYFFKDHFFCLKTNNKFMLVVNNFEIGHIITNKKQDTGFVRLNFDFYSLKNDSAFFLYNYNRNFKEASEKVPTTHPERMKRAVLLSLSGLDSYFSIKLNDTLVQKNKRIYTASHSDSLKHSNYGLSLRSFKRNDSLKEVYNLPSYYIFFVGVSGNASYTSLKVDVSANLLFQLKKHPKYLMGMQANFFVYGIFSEKIVPANSTYSLFNYDIGLRLLKQMKGSLFFNVSPQAMFGKETVSYTVLPAKFIGTGTTQTYDFRGLQLDLGLYNMPPKLQGLYFGGDVFFRFTSSQVIESNGGLKFNIGIKF